MWPTRWTEKACWWGQICRPPLSLSQGPVTHLIIMPNNKLSATVMFLSWAEGQKQSLTLTSTQQIQQDMRQSLALFRSKSLSSLYSDNSNKTLTTQLSGLFSVQLRNTQNKWWPTKPNFTIYRYLNDMSIIWDHERSSTKKYAALKQFPLLAIV